MSDAAMFFNRRHQHCLHVQDTRAMDGRVTTMEQHKSNSLVQIKKERSNANR